MLKFEPTNDNVAVVLDEREGAVITTSNGSVTNGHITGRVIATGLGRKHFLYDGKTAMEKAPCEVGDRVLITNGYHCDSPIKVEDGRIILVLGAHAILAVIKE